MNKNRNKVAAMMMVAAITVSSIAMPVEAAVVGNEGIAIKREKEAKAKNYVKFDRSIKVSKNIQEVELNETNFPDYYFRKFLKDRLNIVDGKISKEDLIGLSSISVDEDVTNLKGIEFFPNLTDLYAEGVIHLDISENRKLERLTLEHNKMNSIYLGNNEELEYLNISYGNIRSVNLSNNKKITTFKAVDSNLGRLELKDNNMLKNINITATNLMRIDLSGAPNLSVFSYKPKNNNKYALEKIDLSKNINLKEIYIKGNIYRTDRGDRIERVGTKEIILGENKNIETININHTLLEEIDLTGCPSLIELTCEKTKISKLDLSKNTKLLKLYCGEYGGYNYIKGEIKELILKNANQLRYIDCKGNKLDNIDFSDCKSLISLDTRENNLKSLDLSNSPDIKALYTDNCMGYVKLNSKAYLSDINQRLPIQTISVPVDKGVKEIDLGKLFPNIDMDKLKIISKDVKKDGYKIVWEADNIQSIKYAYETGAGIRLNVIIEINEEDIDITEGVVLNDTNFKDGTFINYLCSMDFVHDNGDKFKKLEYGKEISAEVIKNITKINVGHSEEYDGYKIESLKGIEYFKNLKNLDCQNNKIDELNIYKNTKLEHLNCDGNGISNLDISKNLELKELYCARNKISDLDVSNNKSLEILYCWDNKISSIDVSNNLELTNLHLAENLLSKIDIKNNDKLKELKISDNEKISEIDLSDKVYLEFFDCGNNNIKNLDISKNTNLKYLDISYYYHNGEYIQNLDVSNNLELRSLICNGNKKLKDIDLSKNTNLEGIFLAKNSLENIDLSNQKELNYLQISENKLRSLDVSNNPKLEEMYISKNEIGKLKVNEDAERWIIQEGDNQIVKLKADGNKIDLNKEFGITESEMKNVTELSEGISKNGTDLTWTGKKPEKVKYTYICGGKNNPVKLFVTLDLSGNAEVIPPEPEKPNPDKPVNPNPDQGGSGGGTTTPDNKPDTKPEEKPNKPIEIRGKIVGKNRYETAAKIADQMGSYNTVILVNSDKSMADGLSAASLSGKKNAPILLVKKNSIPSETMARLEKAENVYIIGGNNVISKKVENQLKGKKITRISGKDRYDTSAKIANLLGDYDTAFIVNGAKGEADAMSVSSVAAKYGAPILLTNGKTSKHLKKANVRYFVIGGKAVVSRALEDRYDADRISGVDRYSTNRKIIDEFYYDSKKVYFAKGDTLVDALAVSALAKEDGVVLVSKKANHKKLEGKKAIQVGGMDFEIDVK